ncbi:uncharacterized protein TNIN_134361 [Trichonephila inaurata madagascariensis]|uniref:Uncharacterized protein n=1 Tax=Trichonephila inaurata madagascariensis TaxID=2747483 RepID=A0A8X7C5T8_9ARAC|nr:uncharacterized protein TNIN_134361 [Trichonephila inaurata madagascariensis]
MKQKFIGTLGVTSSPFTLSASIEHLDHTSHDFADVVQKFRLSFYVDNCLISVSNVTEEKHFIEIAQKVMSTACFNLRGWENACKKAYAACIFVRSVNSDGIKVTLVRAKSRFDPLRTLSIPRL